MVNLQTSRKIRILRAQLRASLVVAAVLATAVGAQAQDAKGLELEQRPLPPLPTSISGSATLDQVMRDWLRKHPDGLKPGQGTLPDGRAYVVSVQTAAIGAQAADPMWVESRYNAFLKAQLKAKADCARIQESRILSETISEYREPDVQRAKLEADRMKRQGLAAEGAAKVAGAIHSDAKARFDSKTLQTAALYAEKLLTSKVDSALRQRGIDPSKPVAEQTVREVADVESLQQTVQVTAQARCTGIKTLSSFEQIDKAGNGSVGVVSIWTEKLHQVADAMLSGNFELIPSGEPGLPIEQHVQIDMRTLLSTVGVQLVRDETGQYVLLAYAQAQPRTRNGQSVEGAKRKARLLADGLVRQFMGELIMLSGDITKKEESTSFADESRAYKNESSFKERIQASAEQASIQGLQEAHAWETLHPTTNAPVVGVVVQWKPSAAQAAVAMQALNNSTARGAKVAGAGPAAPVAPRVGEYSGQGKSSREF